MAGCDTVAAAAVCFTLRRCSSGNFTLVLGNLSCERDADANTNADQQRTVIPWSGRISMGIERDEEMDGIVGMKWRSERRNTSTTHQQADASIQAT